MRLFILANPISIHTQRWATYFANRGHDVHVVYFDSYSQPIKPQEIAGVTLHRIPYIINSLERFNFNYGKFRLKRMIKRINPDIIYGHYISHHDLWYTALLDFHPFVVTIWGSDVLIDPYKSDMLNSHVQYVLNSVDIIHVHSKVLFDAVVKLGGKKSKIKNISWGIDLKKFNPRNSNDKTKLELKPNDEHVVISTRNFKEVYNMETLIKSIPEVVSKFPKVKFVLVGAGPLENDLKQLTKKLKVTKNIHFTGTVPYDDLPYYLNAADIYVSTSLSDGSSQSLHESMACALPPVVTDIPANIEWVEDGVNGFLVPVKKPKMLAEKIIELLKDKDLRKEFGNKNLKTAKNKLDQFKLMKKIEELFLKLIEQT